jgi:hypothetical protein
MQRPHGVTRRHVKLELADDGRHGDERLLLRKYRANTATSPALNARPRGRQEPCRIE